MWVYILNYISIPIYNFIIKDKKIFVILVSIQMFLILALRSETLGVDLANYSLYYNTYKTFSLGEILRSIRVVGYSDIPYGLESGYVLFNWIVASLGFSFHSYLVICAFICMASIGVFIYRYSDNPMLSFAMFLALGGYGYFFGILRQSLGLAIFLFSVPALKKRNFWQYFLIVISASLFHLIFLLAIPLYFFSNIEVKSIHYIIIIIVSVLIAVLTPWIYDTIISKILNILGKYYNIKFEWNNMFLLIILFVLFFNVLGEKKLDNVIKWGFLMALPIQALGFYIPIFSRAAIGIFLCFAYILIANVIENQKKVGQRTMLNVLLYILGFALYFYNLNGSSNVPYISVFNHINIY